MPDQPIGPGTEPAEGDQGDPIQALGGALQAFVEGVQGSQLGDDVKKQAGVVQQDFEQLVQMIQGGGQSGPQPMAGASQMASSNPNAQQVG